jgi:hypothetical protein
MTFREAHTQSAVDWIDDDDGVMGMLSGAATPEHAVAGRAVGSADVRRF